jgi:hypothetical protein
MAALLNLLAGSQIADIGAGMGNYRRVPAGAGFPNPSRWIGVQRVDTNLIRTDQSLMVSYL